MSDENMPPPFPRYNPEPQPTQYSPRNEENNKRQIELQKQQLERELNYVISKPSAQ